MCHYFAHLKKCVLTSYTSLVTAPFLSSLLQQNTSQEIFCFQYSSLCSWSQLQPSFSTTVEEKHTTPVCLLHSHTTTLILVTICVRFSPPNKSYSDTSRAPYSSAQFRHYLLEIPSESEVHNSVPPDHPSLQMLIASPSPILPTTSYTLGFS